jgi:hypothetical protein
MKLRVIKGPPSLPLLYLLTEQTTLGKESAKMKWRGINVVVLEHVNRFFSVFSGAALLMKISFHGD